MIINKTIKTVGGKTFNQLYYSKEYWFVGYDENKAIKVIRDKDSPLTAGQYVGSKLNIFGATSHAELLTEITNRGLTYV